jgi:hypothetical protein
VLTPSLLNPAVVDSRWFGKLVGEGVPVERKEPGGNVQNSAQDDDFVGVSTKDIQDRLTPIGRQSRVNLDRTQMLTGDHQNQPKSL